MGILKNAADMTMWGRLDEARQLVANLVAIRVGPNTTGVSDSAAAAVAFAVGFSERLAKDIIVRISGDKAAPSE
jgi:hypothetical protein